MNKTITQKNNSSEPQQQGEGIISFTDIKYKTGEENQTEIDVVVELSFFIVRNDSIYKNIVNTGQSTNRYSFYSKRDGDIDSNDYPLSINIDSGISNTSTLNYNKLDLKYKLYNDSRSDGIFAFDGVTQFNSLQNVVLGGETKLGIGYTKDGAKTLTGESFHVAKNGIMIHGNSTFKNDLTIEGDTRINGNLIVEEVVGDLLGDVTGDVTGNLTGDVTG